MPEVDDPRRPSTTKFLSHRVSMTKRKSRKIEIGLQKYIYETSKLYSVMDNLIQVFLLYGIDESGETGAMLRVFAKILQEGNNHRIKRQQMLSDVGANLADLKYVYREARETNNEYKSLHFRYKTAKKKHAAIKKLMRWGKSVRKAKCKANQRESELLAKRRALKKVLDEFDKKLRAALLGFFFQFIKCEMFMAARVLETFSDTNSHLKRWTSETKEIKEWILSRSLLKNVESGQK